MLLSCSSRATRIHNPLCSVDMNKALFPAFSAVVALAVASLLSGCGPDAGPAIKGEPPGMRRLSDQQYLNIIEDVFGAGIEVAGRPDPLPRTEGLLAIGSSTARITPSGFEQYYNMGRSISQQVVSEAHRDELIPCTPASSTAADDDCAQAFLSRAGRLLYRRPMTESELQTAVDAARTAAETTGDFYDGIAIALASMLTTPQFLFVIDTVEPDPDDPNGSKLTPYAKASRLSFLLWNSTPDDLLLTAAETGELDTRAGLREQVERMMASPRLYEGVRAFFSDMLDFEKFKTLEKDPTIYPAFNQQVAEDAREQALRTITNHLLTGNKDYRDLFTTRETFISPALARVYRIVTERPAGGWSEYEFPEGDPRAGLVTQIAFTALHSHPGRSSPTLRGKALRELLLCQHVPDPPNNVDFTLFNDPNAPSKTARERLQAHNTAPACAGCHKITDPIGLGLEIFDGAGRLRATENGVELDTNGNLDGIGFDGPAGLAEAVRGNEAATACVVERLTTYAMARPLTSGDREYVEYLQKEFAADDYRFNELLRNIALSDAFYTVSRPADDIIVAGSNLQERE